MVSSHPIGGLITAAGLIGAERLSWMRHRRFHAQSLARCGRFIRLSPFDGLSPKSSGVSSYAHKQTPGYEASGRWSIFKKLQTGCLLCDPKNGFCQGKKNQISDPLTGIRDGFHRSSKRKDDKIEQAGIWLDLSHVPMAWRGGGGEGLSGKRRDPCLPARSDSVQILQDETSFWRTIPGLSLVRPGGVVLLVYQQHLQCKVFLLPHRTTVKIRTHDQRHSFSERTRLR